MTQNEADTRRRVLEAASGHILARAIHTAVELGLADRLSDGPKTAGALARECGADAVALGRLARFLARQGYLEASGELYSLTEAGGMLRSDAPGNAAAVIRSLGSAEVWKAFERLSDAVRIGLPSEHRRGARVYAPGGDPAEEAAFGEAMAGYHWGEAEAVAEAYDFSHVRQVVDVGGSSGRLLIAILTRHPNLDGLVFDRPGIASVASAGFSAAGLGGRCRFRGGNFFDSVPSGGDVYILSHILHDWGDDEARAILESCRRVCSPESRLLIAEALASSPEEASHPMPADLLLLANTEGRHRSLGEYEALLESAGFRFNRLIRTAADVSLVEALPC